MLSREEEEKENKAGTGYEDIKGEKGFYARFFLLLLKNAASTKNTNHIVRDVAHCIAHSKRIYFHQEKWVNSEFALFAWISECGCHKSVKCNSTFIDVCTRPLCVNAENTDFQRKISSNRVKKENESLPRWFRYDGDRPVQY